MKQLLKRYIARIRWKRERRHRCDRAALQFRMMVATGALSKAPRRI